MRWHPLRSVRRRRELNSSAPFANKRTQQVCHTTILVYACAATYVSSYCIRCVMVLVQVCHATSLQVCHTTSLCMCCYVRVLILHYCCCIRVLILDYMLLHTCPHAALYAATYVSACCTTCCYIRVRMLHYVSYGCIRVLTYCGGGVANSLPPRHAPTNASGARRRGRVTLCTVAALEKLCCSSVAAICG